MNFGCLEASTSELCVSENSAASISHLQNTTKCVASDSNSVMPHHDHIYHMHPLTLGCDGWKILTGRAQRDHKWWRKVPYISIL